MIQLVTGLISAFVSSKVGQTKIPGFSQKIGEFATSKTNALSSVLIGYAFTLLSGEPDLADRIIGNIIVLYAAYGTFSRDTQFKK